MKYKKSKTSTYNINYHIIWCPKYRRKVLTSSIALRLKELLLIKAKQINLHIKKMEILLDHVHVFVEATPLISLHKIVHQFKGYSSRILRNEFKENGMNTIKSKYLWKNNLLNFESIYKKLVLN